MSRNIFYLFCFAMAAQLFTSCSGDKFSQIVEIELPEHTPLLSVSAEFSDVDTMLTVFVYQSYATNERPDSTNVANATVKLYKDGELVREFLPRQYAFIQDSYEAEGNGLLAAADGSTYRLEVSAPGFSTVFAEQKMPKKVEIVEMTVKPDNVPDPDGSKLDELIVEFDDPAGEENYYELDAFQYGCYDDGVDTFCYNNNVYLDTFDPLLEFGPGNSLIINDKTFDGKRVKLRATSYNTLLPQSPGDRLVAQLVHITKERYLFLRSLAQYQENDGNPFAEPVTVQGNINGGVGLFSLEAVDTMQLGF